MADEGIGERLRQECGTVLEVVSEDEDELLAWVRLHSALGHHCVPSAAGNRIRDIPGAVRGPVVLPGRWRVVGAGSSEWHLVPCRRCGGTGFVSPEAEMWRDEARVIELDCGRYGLWVEFAVPDWMLDG
jgi:hypothetical protein